MKIGSIEKIEEMIENVDKKIHAGEWIRVDIVRRMLAEAMIWAYQDFKATLVRNFSEEEE
tara:strand:+ start:21 stop:200 length:180 start_codon:yes stop_codon:yes gene_type:complete